MKQLLIFGLLLMGSMRVAGQARNVDSLLNVLETQQLSISEQVLIYFTISNSYRILYDFEKSSEYGKKGLMLAEKERDKAMISRFYGIFGKNYGIQGSYDTSLIYMKKSLEFAIESKDLDLEASAYDAIGATYGNMGDYLSSIEYIIKALSIHESKGNKKRCCASMINIATLYEQMLNNERALYYFEKARDIAEELDDKVELMGVYFGLGKIYFQSREIEKVEQALKYGLEAYEYSINYNHKHYQIAFTDLLQGIYSLYFKEYDLALKYADEGLKVAGEIGDPRMIRGAWNALSNIYLLMERFNESEVAALNAWEIDTTDVHSGMNALNNIILANIGLGNREKAASFLDKHGILMRRSIEQSSQKTFAEMEVKYETEKKDMQIASLEKERKLYLWLGIAGVLLAVALGLVLLQIIRNRRKERRLIASVALQEGEIGERVRIAEDLHDRLGGSLSAMKIGLNNAESLQSISEKLDTCMRDLRDITNNIIPRSLRLYGMKGALEDLCTQYDNLQFHFFGDDARIKDNLEYTVYCCARELVNNAQKHAGASTVNLQLVQSRKHVSLTVQDDGCGFDERTVVKGDGLQNIRNRIASCRGRMDIVSAPGKGTETVIEINM